jgi:hypothetical protein
MTTWTMTAIAEEMARRRLAQSPLIERMIEVRDRNNGDVVVPVPEMDDDIPLGTLAPLLIADAIEFPATMAAQVAPNITVPSLTPGKQTGVRSIDYASRRRKAIAWTWEKSWWDLLIGRFYRHLSAYATSALVVDLDVANRRPRLTLRDPLSAYPEPKAPEDLSLPMNVGFITGLSLDTLHKVYPETKELAPRGAAFATSAGAGGEGEMWDIVEWMDENEIVIGLLGPRNDWRSWTSEPMRWCRELRRYPNVLGRCPAIIPRKVTLDRIISQLSNLTGHSDIIAKLMYLDIRATERSIFPDKYVISKTGQNPRLVDGRWHEGESGEINLVMDADAIGEMRGTPDPNNKMTMDRIERNMRVSSGLVPQAGGETYGALRTGRGIDALMGAALDPKTAELHKVAERYFAAANELILLGFRKMWPSKSYNVGSELDPGSVVFVPEDHVETDASGQLYLENRVHYPIPGMDDINATQVIGQMLGTGLISAFGARRMHPHVRDPEGEERQILVENLQSMNLAALGQRAAQGGIPPADLARLTQLVMGGMSLIDAEIQVDKEASERQAALPPAPTEGQLAAPEAMPGLASPGEGAEMGGGMPIEPPPPAVDNLNALVAAMQAPA